MLGVGIALMLGSLLFGVPVYLGLFIGAILIALYEMGIDPMVMTTIMFNKINLFVLMAVPFFLLAGYLLSAGGAAKALVDVLNVFMRHIPGGPAYAIIMGCVIFAAMSSSSMAAVAGFAPIMLPMMADMGYDRRFSIGLLVVSSTLGPLIPPSILLIIYGVIADESVKDLYLAAFLPGFMIAFLLFLTAFFWSIRGSYKTLPVASWGERWRAVRRGWPVMIMPPIVLVPIYAGWVTPTEAGVVCAAYAFFLGAVVYRQLKFPQVWASFRDTVRICAMIFIIVMAAFLINMTLTYLRVPFNLSEMITDANLGSSLFLFVVIVLFLLMGMFLDPTAIILVTVPIMLPAVIELGISPLVFGIMMSLGVGIAGITPPYGMLLFTAVGVLKEPFTSVTRGCMLFYPAMIVGMFLIAYVPKISLFLVDLL